MSFSGKDRPPAVEADDAMDATDTDVPEVLRRTRSAGIDPSGEEDMLADLRVRVGLGLVSAVGFALFALCPLLPLVMGWRHKMCWVPKLTNFYQSVRERARYRLALPRSWRTRCVMAFGGVAGPWHAAIATMFFDVVGANITHKRQSA